jgi:hypothetical protein
MKQQYSSPPPFLIRPYPSVVPLGRAVVGDSALSHDGVGARSTPVKRVSAGSSGRTVTAWLPVGFWGEIVSAPSRMFSLVSRPSASP